MVKKAKFCDFFRFGGKVEAMHTFVYGSRVIENEQQIRLERHAQRIGSWVGTVVKFLAAFFSFVALNALLGNIVQHTNLFSVNTYVNLLRFLEEATRVLFVDNAFTTSSFMCQFAIGVVSAFAVYCVAEYGFTLRTLGVGSEKQEDEEDHDTYRQSQTVVGFNTVAYKQKVCFLS